MSILVVGTIAYDSVETPEGNSESQLGGSAVYFALSASYFTKVQIVGVVGKDFYTSDLNLLESHNIDTSGIEISDGKTFRWKGNYKKDINEAITLDTQLNVLETFNPVINNNFSKSENLFLANVHPSLQSKVHNSMSKKLNFCALDTMNLWIDTTNNQLKNIIKKVDAIIINENEAKTLSGETNYINAAEKLRNLGARIVLIKRGEYGVSLFGEDFTFSAPAFPIKKVQDPTGAGDTFAGGFLGYLDLCKEINQKTLKSATIIGSVMASFTVENFGIEKLSNLSKNDINQRFKSFVDLTKFNEKIEI